MRCRGEGCDVEEGGRGGVAGREVVCDEDVESCRGEVQTLWSKISFAL